MSQIPCFLGKKHSQKNEICIQILQEITTIFLHSESTHKIFYFHILNIPKFG
jgi:hypothetical protein